MVSSGEDADDCAVELQEMLLDPNVGPEDLDAPGAAPMVKRRALWHARICARRLRQHYLHFVLLCDLCSSESRGFAREEASPTPSPEEIAGTNAELELALDLIAELPAEQRRIYVLLEGGSRRATDLAGELGRTPNSLYIEMARIRKKLRNRMAAITQKPTKLDKSVSSITQRVSFFEK